jgi:hypothetical protein
MATEVCGVDCKLYHNTGSYGSPTWNEVPNCRDVTPDLTKTKADFSSRGSRFKRYRGGLIDVNIQFSMIWDATDTDMEIFRDMFLNSTEKEVAVSDGAIATAGNEYLRAICECFKFTRNEPLDDAVTVDIELAPAPDTNAPSWATAS